MFISKTFISTYIHMYYLQIFMDIAYHCYRKWSQTSCLKTTEISLTIFTTKSPKWASFCWIKVSVLSLGNCLMRPESWIYSLPLPGWRLLASWLSHFCAPSASPGSQCFLLSGLNTPLHYVTRRAYSYHLDNTTISPLLETKSYLQNCI